MMRPGFTAFSGSARAGGIHRLTSSAHKQHVLRALPQPRDVANSLSSVSLLTSVKVFDGSDITNTVVVSNSFWTQLASKLPYLILAQLVASIAFVAIASFAAAQGKFLIDQVASDATSGNSRRNNSQFRRANEPPPPPLDFAKLFLCLCIDILGSANEAIPLVGELVDVVYAPVAALLLRQMFSGSNIIFLLEFTEEILPFTDILPLGTICWVIESFFGSSSLASALRIGDFAPNKIVEDAIDVGVKARDDALDVIDAKLLPQWKKDADNGRR